MTDTASVSAVPECSAPEKAPSRGATAAAAASAAASDSGAAAAAACATGLGEGGGVLSPLSGAYLLMILGEPISDVHKEKMMAKIKQGNSKKNRYFT